MLEGLDSNSRARVYSFQSQMKLFDFLFGLNLLFNVLRHTDNLSKTLQHTEMSAAVGQRLAAMTVATVKSTRNEETFRLFWDKTLTESASLDIGQPTVPRKCKPPISQCTVSEVNQSEAPMAIHHYRYLLRNHRHHNKLY